MNRRGFLRAAGALPASLAFAQTAPRPVWRTFEVTTRIEVLKPSGATRVWTPAVLIADTPWQKTLANTYRCDSASARLLTTTADSMGVVAAEFPASSAPILTVVSRVATRDRFMGDAPASPDGLDHWLRPTKLLPLDGIVRQRALQITAAAPTSMDKARAVYEWIVENTSRNPNVRGCGLGNIRFVLESGDLSGKCADINALYVGLARTAGLPARDVYGIRIAPSQLGDKSLGPSSDNVSKAQHCRAEVYVQGLGWIAVDAADVRKVMLEEPAGNRPPDDEMVLAARQRLFGSWEGNWMAWNFAHDVALPGSSREPLGYLMYPQAETAEGRVDCLDPDNFRYEIAAREIPQNV